MAFGRAGLSPNQEIRVGNEPMTWTYSSADAHTAVDAVDYFTGGSNLGMRVGDTVIVHDTNVETSTIHRVITATALGDATISNATLV